MICHNLLVNVGYVFAVVPVGSPGLMLCVETQYQGAAMMTLHTTTVWEKSNEMSYVLPSPNEALDVQYARSV